MVCSLVKFVICTYMFECVMVNNFVIMYPVITPMSHIFTANAGCLEEQG